MITENESLDVRSLRKRIIANEYERLDDKTKNKLINKEKIIIGDLVKNPIIIKNSKNINYENISEEVLKRLILENLDDFMTKLGEGFSYIGQEYKIMIGNRPNYIDLLLYNIKYNCYVVLELKITELKKEHLGQIGVYMNYVDKHIKTIKQDKMIGIIIVKKDNKILLEYSSDDRIMTREFILI